MIWRVCIALAMSLLKGVQVQDTFIQMGMPLQSDDKCTCQV